MLSVLDRSAVDSFLKICHREIPKGNCYVVPRNYVVNGKRISFREALLRLGIMNEKQKYERNRRINDKNNPFYDHNLCVVQLMENHEVKTFIEDIISSY